MTDGSGSTHRECSREKKPTVWAPPVLGCPDVGFFAVGTDGGPGALGFRAHRIRGRRIAGRWPGRADFEALKEEKPCCNWNRN